MPTALPAWLATAVAVDVDTASPSTLDVTLATAIASGLVTIAVADMLLVTFPMATVPPLAVPSPVTSVEA